MKTDLIFTGEEGCVWRGFSTVAATLWACSHWSTFPNMINSESRVETEQLAVSLMLTAFCSWARSDILVCYKIVGCWRWGCRLSMLLFAALIIIPLPHVNLCYKSSYLDRLPVCPFDRLVNRPTDGRTAARGGTTGGGSKKYFRTSTQLWRTNNLLTCPRVVSFGLIRKNLRQSRSTKPKIILYV